MNSKQIGLFSSFQLSQQHDFFFLEELQLFSEISFVSVRLSLVLILQELIQKVKPTKTKQYYHAIVFLR